MKDIIERYFNAGRCELDYPEDKHSHYFNNCASCKEDYIGYKRTSHCFKCHTEHQTFLATMTKEERKEFDIKQIKLLLKLTMGD